MHYDKNVHGVVPEIPSITHQPPYYLQKRHRTRQDIQVHWTN